MKMEGKKWTLVIMIILAVNLAVSAVLLVFFIQRSNAMESRYVSIQHQLDDLEDEEETDISGQLSMFASVFAKEMDSKIDAIVGDIKNEIAGVENTFSEYDDDIQKITTELETLNENVATISDAIEKIEGIVDGIRNFFKIS